MASHEKTFRAIFERPVRADIGWREIESLFRHLGAEIQEGSGSRVKVILRGVRAVFHRPHPQKEAGKGLVRQVCKFLAEAGVDPNV